MAFKKKIIIGGFVSTVAVGLTIFLVLFLGKQGPFFQLNTTAQVDQEPSTVATVEYTSHWVWSL